MFVNLLVLHVLFAVPALVLVFRNELSRNDQKGYQAAVSFFVPLIGPILTLIMILYLRAKPSSPNRNVGDSADDHIRNHGHHF